MATAGKARAALFLGSAPVCTNKASLPAAQRPPRSSNRATSYTRAHNPTPRSITEGFLCFQTGPTGQMPHLLWGELHFSRCCAHGTTRPCPRALWSPTQALPAVTTPGPSCLLCSTHQSWSPAGHEVESHTFCPLF